MNQQENGDQYVPDRPKRTRKNKTFTPTISNRQTRRAKRKDSSEQNTLPENIPRNEFEAVETQQFFQEQTTKFAIQIPLFQFTQSEFKREVDTRAETVALQIQIFYEKNSITFNIRVHEDFPLEEDQEISLSIHGKCCFLGQSKITSKTLKSVTKSIEKQNWVEFAWQKIDQINSDFFVLLTIKKQQEIWEQNVGLVNQGNTCYMNSYLQMLFHLPQFRYALYLSRQLIFSAETKEPDRFPATLQMLFYRMLTQDRSVSPEELIKSFGWSKKDAQVQQDVQEFSCLFFQILQQKVVVFKKMGYTSSVNELFCGQLTHYIQCIDVGTNHQRFFDIHLAVTPRLELSLDIYIEEQDLNGDNKYHAGIHGLQDAKKGVKISKLPPVLMCQLKRFQFNFYTQSNEKIMGECSYPQKIDFSRWTTNPEKPKPYQLYAVLVHQGSHANSGHYYVFIKRKHSWIKFNDERVEIGSRDKALRFNYGGDSDTVELCSKELKKKYKKHQNTATAYMLVYVSELMYDKLFQQNEIKYPQWLIEKTKQRKQWQQQKKLRKQSICDIPIMRWKMIKGKDVSIGFLSSDLLEDSNEKVDKILKGMKVQEWLKQFQKQQQDSQVYIHWTSQDKEVIVNASCRLNSLVKQLFSEVIDPTIVFLPTKASKQEYLVVIKQFSQHQSEQSGQSLQTEVTIKGLCTIPKDEQRKGLKKKLSLLYKGQNNAYYVQDRKHVLINLNDNDLLPASSPTRNQLLVVIVDRQAKGSRSEALQKWYQEEINTLKIQIICEQDRSEAWDYEVNKNMEMKDLRDLVFNDFVKDKEEYQSADNVVIRYRAKKNSKALSEVSEEDQIKDLIKVQRSIYYSYSQLGIKQRETRKQLCFYCRFQKHLQLSQLQKIVIEKNNKSSIVDLIFASEQVKSIFPTKIGHGLRMFLLSKDKTYINAIVDDKGHVHKKGQLLSVLNKEKHTSLVVEQFAHIETDQTVTNILIHHVAKTGQKMGTPRWEYAISSALLSKLKYYILQKVEKDEIEFQGRVHQLNPMKVRILSFMKEWSKAEQMPEPREFMQQKSEEEEETIESKYGTPKCLRVGILHNSISKSQQTMKINVE